jgi:hypothetical protein
MRLLKRERGHERGQEREGGRGGEQKRVTEQDNAERVCCLLVLDSVTSTPQDPIHVLSFSPSFMPGPEPKLLHYDSQVSFSNEIWES